MQARVGSSAPPVNVDPLSGMVRPGLEILSDDIGSGDLVERRKWHVFRFRVWLKRGDPVVWDRAWGTSGSRLDDGGKTLFTKARVDREFLYNGFFYTVLGMRVGGTRRVRIAPHLAFGARGIDGVIPPNALLTVECHCVEACGEAG